MNETERLELAQKRYQEGKSALEIGDTARAISLFKDSASASPHFTTLELLGSTLLSEGDAATAAVYLAASAGMNPKQSKARYLLAQALLSLGTVWTADAVAQLRECLRVNPSYAHAKTLLASLLAANPTLLDEDAS